MFNKAVLTTGVLTREPATISAVINVANMDANDAHHITVEVWDWSSYDSPVALPVLIGENVPVDFPYLLPPRHLAVMYTDLNAHGVTLYEMRITHPIGANVVANCFGRSRPPYTSQEGNTVLQKQLVYLVPGVLSLI
jgi:hypothetical protein